MNFYPFNVQPIDAGVFPTPYETGRVSFGIVLGLGAKIFGLTVDRDLEWNGRNQVGQAFSLGLQTLSPSPFSSVGIRDPDDVPSFRIYSTGVPTRAYRIPIDKTSYGVTGAFRGAFTPGSYDGVGKYFVLYSYRVESSSKAILSMFEVVDGGHPNGYTISSFSFGLPSGANICVHDGSGNVCVGKRPYLDIGSGS